MLLIKDIPNILYKIISDIQSITYTLRYVNSEQLYDFIVFTHIDTNNIPYIITSEINHYHIIEFPSVLDSTFNIKNYKIYNQLKSNKNVKLSNYSKVTNLLNCIKYITKTTNDITQIIYSEPYTKITTYISFYYYPFILCLLDLCLPNKLASLIFNNHYNLLIFDSNINIDPRPYHHKCQEYYTIKYYGIQKTMDLYRQRISFNIDINKHLDESYFNHFKLNYNTELSTI